MRCVAFVPIKLNSQRVKDKAVRKIGGRPLYEFLLETLVSSEIFDDIYVFCSSDSLASLIPDGVRFLKRPASLDKDETLGSEIYEEFIRMIDADIYFLAHITSPFLSTRSIRRAVETVRSGKADSVFPVKREQNFCWFKGQPLNYKLENIPRTQELEPVFIESSGFFCFKKWVWAECGSRIGGRYEMQQVSAIEAIDIDTEEDLEIASHIANGINACVD